MCAVRCSPPGKIRIGSGPSVVPLISIRLKLEVIGVTVTQQHVKAVFSFVVVPLAPRILLVAVGIPRPVALDNLVRWAAGDLARFDIGVAGGVPFAAVELPVTCFTRTVSKDHTAR